MEVKNYDKFTTSQLPSTPISKIDKKWGLHNAEIICDEYTDPPLNYVIKKTRNAFAHPRIDVNVPPGIDETTSIKKLLTETYFTLEDIHTKGKHFKMKINIRDLTYFSSEVYTTMSKQLHNSIK